MKIFRNRGDIYFSKSGSKADKEQQALSIILCFIVLFSVIFVTIVGVRNDFSAKKFFAPDETIVINDENVEEELPVVSGKSNYLLLLTGRDERTLYLASLLQFDMDSLSYKVCNLLPETKLDGNPISSVFEKGGINNLVNATETMLDVDVNYYIVMNIADFAKLYDQMGKVNYPLAEDVRFRDGGSEDTYSLRFSAGEQKIDGKQFVSLLRYYVNEKKDCSKANELALAALNQLINSETEAKKEEIFKDFVLISKTNITVKDFSEKTDNIKVISNERVGVNSYNVQAEYSNNSLTRQSKSKIKSYFAN